MKKHNCRMTPEEKERHDRAVKIRKMTDEQICQYIDECKGVGAVQPVTENKSVAEFLKAAEEVKGIGLRTIQRLYDFAEAEGYLT